MTGDKGKRGLPYRIDMVGVLRSADAERQLSPGQPHQVAGPEHLARGQATGEVVHRGAAHERVVHIEEGRGAGILGWRRVLDFASLMSTTRMSSTMASTILRTLSAWAS